MIVFLPTDTCYGLAGPCTDAGAEQIYAIKGRSREKRLALLVRDMAMLEQYAEITDTQKQFLRDYPFPWSVILPRKFHPGMPPLLLSDAYREISFRVAERCMPDIYTYIEEDLQKKAHTVSIFPLFLTSANRSGENEAHTLQEAIIQCGQWHGYDAGVRAGAPSDIFRFTPTGEIKYIRRNYGEIIDT